MRAAAPHQIRRDRSRLALALEKSDLREKVRVRRSTNLILFVVDASWSMAVAERMEATKGAIMSLLTDDAYQRRDRVGLIVFNKTMLPWYYPHQPVPISQEGVERHRCRRQNALDGGLIWPTRFPDRRLIAIPTCCR